MRSAAGTVLNRRGRPDVVDDPAQEALAQVMDDKAARFVAGKAPVGAWLYSLAYYAAIDVARSGASHHQERIIVTVELTEAMREVFPAPDPVEEAGERQQALARRDTELARAAELVAGLRPGLRAVIELTYQRGLSRAEVAAELGLPEAATVKSRIRPGPAPPSPKPHHQQRRPHQPPRPVSPEVSGSVPRRAGPETPEGGDS